MDEEGGGKGLLWAGLTVALVAAIVFVVLWVMRGGTIRQLENNLRAAESAATSTAQRLESDLRTARSDGDAARRRAADLEVRLHNETRRLSDAATQTERNLRYDLANAKRALAEALDEAQTGLERETAALRAELDKAKAELEEKKSSGERETTRLTAELRGSRETVRELEGRLAESGEKLTAAETDLRAARAELTKRPSGGDVTALRAALGKAEQDLAEARNANAVLEKVKDALAVNLERERQTAQARERESGGVATGSDSGGETDAGELLARTRRLEKDLEECRGAAARREKELLERLETEKKAWQTRLEELEKAGESETGAVEGQQTSADAVSAARPIAVAEPPAVAPTAEEPAEIHAAITPAPRRALSTASDAGRIVEKEADGRTLLINVGKNQWARPGMKFDVYRADGDLRRFIGGIRVPRVLDDFSMAVTTDSEPDLMICPVTGRALREPGAVISPFAVDANGRQVGLLPGVDFLGGVPDVGDYIDNPFYDPKKQNVFAMDADLCPDLCVYQAVETLGGIPRCTADPSGADYLLVKNGVVFADASGGGPRRVALGHLANYLDPRLYFSF